MYAEPFIRYSDFPRDSPIQLVIDDISTGSLYGDKFIRFKAFFPYEKGDRRFTVIFPLYKFRREYLKFTVADRTAIGNCDILIEVIKKAMGKLEITKLEKYNSKIHI